MRTKLQQLRIKHLTLLDGIGSLGSLHAVAAAMHMTQPALTNMLQEIEAIFGTPLFVRSKRGLAANSVGTALIWRARLILNELARADSEVTEILGGRIEITMGVTPMMMLEIIPSALAEIEKAMPNLRLTFVERNVPTLLGELAQGKIDIVLSSVPHDDSATHEKEAFEYLYLFDEELCVMVRNEHELASKKTIDWNELATAQWVLPVEGSLTRRSFSMAFIQRNLTPPEPKYTSSSFHSNARIVARTDCLMVAPSTVGRHYASIGLVKMLDLDFSKRNNPIAFILRKNRVRTEAEDKIISILLAQLEQQRELAQA